MNILIIPSWYPTAEKPTSGIFFKEQVIALKKMGLTPIVIYPEIKSIKKIGCNIDFKVHKEIEDGVPTFRLRGYNFFPRIPLGGCLVFWNNIKKLYKEVLMDIGKPDLIHAHSCIWAGVSALKLSEKEDIPFVITEHSSVIGKGAISEFQSESIKKVLVQANHVISVGPGLAMKLKKMAPNQVISVIPNIVDIDFFKHEKMIKRDTDIFKFFSLANLNHNKGMDILIKAFAKYLINRNVELVIGGDGEERENLQRLIKDLKLEKQIKLIGSLDRYRVKEEMQNCNCFVLASRFETFGVVFIEALACGKPIIATKCGGPQSIVNENNGMLVEVDDVDGVGLSMVNLIKSPERFNSTIIREDCINRFSELVIINKIKNVYNQILTP